MSEIVDNEKYHRKGFRWQDILGKAFSKEDYPTSSKEFVCRRTARNILDAYISLVLDDLIYNSGQVDFYYRVGGRTKKLYMSWYVARKSAIQHQYSYHSKYKPENYSLYLHMTSYLFNKTNNMYVLKSSIETNKKLIKEVICGRDFIEAPYITRKTVREEEPVKMREL